MPNRLIHETSPYLLQHAHNPVDWYPWGEEALSRARDEDKPILLSIGYSACHWCHVMEHESFENPDIARLMNEHFVSVKVDREERPDLDSVYMAAVQAMTQRGGWPMTVFLTPEGAPFYCGTYFPPEDRMGMPGFPRVLRSVARAYAERRGEVEQSGQRLVEHLRQAPGALTEEGSPPSEAILAAAAQALASSFDSQGGGFGGAPKFPQPMTLEFLLRAFQRSHDPSLLQMAELTLTKMARGGMYDQLGGGFHRYSVDGQWLVPHFEKMLYDNAQLALVYLHAYRLTGKAAYRQVTEETLEYLTREMTAPEGGFYSTQDADSEGQEGKYFVWTPDEVRTLLSQEEARAFERFYDVTERGNFEGKSILHQPLEAADAARNLGLDEHSLATLLERGRQRLKAAREGRIHPGRDEKILTAWNGLAIEAFAEAGAILARPHYIATARRAAEFLLREQASGGRLRRSYKDGQSRLSGYLEDYANLASALLTLYEASLEARWFQAARTLAETTIDLFWEEAEGCFYDTARDHEALISRPRDSYDNATPAGSSVATQVLIRLWLFTAEERFRTIAERVLRAMQRVASSYPLGFGRLLCAYDLYVGPAKEVALIGDPRSAEVRSFWRETWSTPLPNKVLAAAAPDDGETIGMIPLLTGRDLVNGRAAAYVCQSFACQAPVTDPAALRALLAS